MEERFILFKAGGEGFAFPVSEICEVMEPQTSYPVPRAPGHVLGLINFHGTLTALVDLGLYRRRYAPKVSGKVLVLDSKLAHLALKVDAVVSIINREAVLAEEADDDPLTAALLETAHGSFRLLRLEPLLFSLEQGLGQPQPAGAA